MASRGCSFDKTRERRKLSRWRTVFKMAAKIYGEILQYAIKLPILQKTGTKSGTNVPWGCSCNKTCKPANFCHHHCCMYKYCIIVQWNCQYYSCLNDVGISQIYQFELRFIKIQSNVHFSVVHFCELSPIFKSAIPIELLFQPRRDTYHQRKQNTYRVMVCCLNENTNRSKHCNCIMSCTSAISGSI